MTTTARQCKALTQRGEPCRAAAIPGSDWCTFHDPARAVDQLDAKRRGGKARHGRQLNAEPTDPIRIRTTGDIVALLESEINAILTLERSLQRARTVGYLALAALKAHELNELADRVAALEMVLKART